MTSRTKAATTTHSRRVVAKKRSSAKRLAAEGKNPATTKAHESPPGGQRGPGRPKGSGKFGEETKAIRFPVSLIDQLDAFVRRHGDVFRLYSDQVQAGFPSPAEDEVPFEPYDLGTQLVPNPASTFFIRVTGESMRDAGIFPGDVLIVDRSLDPRSGDVVVAAINGEFTVKRLFKMGQRVELRPENKDFHPIVITSDMDFILWGVVKTVIHHV